MIEDDYRAFRNLSIEDQLRYGSVQNWKKGVEEWTQESKQEPTLKVVGQRSECAMPTILNMSELAKSEN